MKIMKRTEFLKLPAGTVFCNYEPVCFGDLTIKGDTLDTPSGDFYIQQIVDSIDAPGSGEMFDMLFKAEETGESVPMTFDCESRDGMFDPSERLYAVLERHDVEALIGRFQRALESYALPTVGQTGLK